MFSVYRLTVQYLLVESASGVYLLEGGSAAYVNSYLFEAESADCVISYLSRGRERCLRDLKAHPE